MWDVEVDKPIKEYASHGPGEILQAPNGNVYKIYNKKYYSVNISSWIGLGGMHYYGTFHISINSVGDVDNPNMHHGGFLGGLDITCAVDVEVTTPVTTEHRKSDPERFSREDERTVAFMDEESVKKAIREFQEKHLKGWDTSYSEDDY